MASWKPSDYTQGRYLKTADISQPTVVTVQGSTVEEFRDGEQKPSLQFLELNQRLVLNKSRVEQCISIMGPDPDQWKGRQIVIAPGRSFNGGAMIVVQPAPAPQAPTAAPGETAMPAERPIQYEESGDVVFAAR